MDCIKSEFFTAKLSTKHFEFSMNFIVNNIIVIICATGVPVSLLLSLLVVRPKIPDLIMT